MIHKTFDVAVRFALVLAIMAVALVGSSCKAKPEAETPPPVALTEKALIENVQLTDFKWVNAKDPIADFNIENKNAFAVCKVRISLKFIGKDAVPIGDQGMTLSDPIGPHQKVEFKGYNLAVRYLEAESMTSGIDYAEMTPQ